MTACWNLITTKYNDGTNITNDNQWNNLTIDAYCAYDNNNQNAEKYGYLYNRYAFNTSKLATEDWEELINYCGGKIKADKLKSKTDWLDEGGNCSDIYGFYAYPGGCRGYFFIDGGKFRYMEYDGFWWTGDNYGCMIFIDFYKVSHARVDSIAINSFVNMNAGASIQLIKK